MKGACDLIFKGWTLCHWRATFSIQKDDDSGVGKRSTARYKGRTRREVFKLEKGEKRGEKMTSAGMPISSDAFFVHQTRAFCVVDSHDFPQFQGILSNISCFPVLIW